MGRFSAAASSALACFLLSSPPMETLTQTAPDKLEIRSGGGVLSLFGLPFLAAGVFLLCAGLGIVELENSDEIPRWSHALIVLMGLVFAAVGGGLFFGRTWTTIERTRGFLTRRHGLIVPMRVEKHLLCEFDTVVLAFRSGDSDSSDRFPVRFHPKAGGKEYPLCEPAEYATARAYAEQIAGLLGLPIKDATTDNATTLAADEFSAPFQKRARQDDLRRADHPRTLRSHVEEGADGVTITIPGPRRHPATLLLLAAPAGALWWVTKALFPLFEGSDTPEMVQWIALGFIALFALFPTVGLVSSIVRPKRAGTSIRASASGIVVEEKKGWKEKTTTIPAGDILDIDFNTRQGSLRSAYEMAIAQGQVRSRVPRSMQSLPSWFKWIYGIIPSKGITVKSRTGLHVFAAGLPDDEVEYLHSIITRALMEQ
jgi:hypothetical protein